MPTFEYVIDLFYADSSWDCLTGRGEIEEIPHIIERYRDGHKELFKVNIRLRQPG